eukprot:3299291-Amphidinium_carterae.1
MSAVLEVIFIKGNGVPCEIQLHWPKRRKPMYPSKLKTEVRVRSQLERLVERITLASARVFFNAMLLKI